LFKLKILALEVIDLIREYCFAAPNSELKDLEAFSSSFKDRF